MRSSGSQLAPPLVPFPTHAQQGGADDADDEGGDEREGALVAELRGLPCVGVEGVKDGDEDGGGDEGEEEAC
jgi:hypothetical protein